MAVNFPGATMIRMLPTGAALALLSLGAVAQAPAPPAEPPKSSVFVTCRECGVVQSVKRVETNPPATEAERKATSGLVASAPLGGGETAVGSITDVRRELKPAAISYEIVVRLDDGRFQLVRQDDGGQLRQGDKVRIERGKAVPR
jgi:hypothetical protein